MTKVAAVWPLCAAAFMHFEALQGLALDVVLRDNAATERTAPAEFLAPWTDLHAQLFKVEAGITLALLR